MKNKVRFICGWIGSVLLAVCGLPQLLMIIEQGHANGMSFATMLMWFLGEVFMFVPIMTTPELRKSRFLVFNYLTNITIVATMIVYKVKGG